MKIDQKAALASHLEQLLKATGASLARRMPQRIAAERAGISRDTLSRIENGDPSVAIGQVMRYLATLDKAELVARARKRERCGGAQPVGAGTDPSRSCVERNRA